MRKDIDLNFNPHPLTGDINTKKGVSAIEQSMKNLVLTNYYERGFNIEVYSDIGASLFENDDPLLRETLKTNIERVLKVFEKDVEIVRIDVTTSRQYENTLDVFVYYNIFNDPEERVFRIELERLR